MIDFIGLCIGPAESTPTNRNTNPAMAHALARDIPSRIVVRTTP
jgi:hypothetical protein